MVKRETVSESLYPLSGQFYQPKRGNRYGMEAVALAFFPHLASGMRIIDLGTGTGIIPVILGQREKDLEIHAVEKQPFLARLAVKNLYQNGLGERFTLYQGDLGALTDHKSLAATFDLVIANPPFHAVARTRKSSDDAKAFAHFAKADSFKVWLETAAWLLKKGGRFCLVFPRGRFLECWQALAKLNFKPLRLSWICPKKNGVPRFFLLSSTYLNDFCRLTVLPDIYP